MPIITAAWASEVATLLPSPTYAMVRPVSDAETLQQRQQVGQRLARVLLVGERVDDVEARRRGRELLEHLLRERANDDGVHPAFEVAGDVGRRLAAAERDIGGNEDRDRRPTLAPRLQTSRGCAARACRTAARPGVRQAASRRAVGRRRAPASDARRRPDTPPAPRGSDRPATETSAPPIGGGAPARVGRAALSGCTRAPVRADVGRLMFDTPR